MLFRRSPIEDDFAFGDSSFLLQAQDLELPVAIHASHPKFWDLVWLVTQAVIEVVVVALPGYIVARRGGFDANAQKFVANLNITLFTPCLIFSKLASQLQADELKDLAIIPVILLVQTVISYICAKIACRIFRIRKQPQNNFITAMAVFGNSNSVPLSLVISLSHTISGLHWDQRPNDNDNEVMARGILYLLIFSQLGQAVRWSWGMNTLLRPLDTYTPEERGELPAEADEESFEPYKDDPAPAADPRREHSESSTSASSVQLSSHTVQAANVDGSAAGEVDGVPPPAAPKLPKRALTHRDSIPHIYRRATHPLSADDVEPAPNGDATPYQQLKRTQSAIGRRWDRLATSVGRRVGEAKNITAARFDAAFKQLPEGAQKVLSRIGYAIGKFAVGVYESLNVPLIAILISLLVAVIPGAKDVFFHPHSPVNNSFTTAIKQMGNVAVPLILVVLGANLARNTLPDEGLDSPEYQREERNMVIASLVCRMLLPTILMAPILALMAKYVPISILDDPIFVIVCFLLSGAPSALQLAQMCQVNEVYVGAVSRILFHSYVIW